MSRADSPPAVVNAPPARLRATLMPAVPAIVEEAIAAIRSGHPDWLVSRQALERNLRLGLTDAVDRWFDPSLARSAPDLHFALGRAQARAGRDLDELMGFYRTAAQIVWRRVSEVGSARGARPQDLYRLAEAGFGCVDELSTRAAAGFTDEQSQRSGASHSRRSELVRLLLRDPQPGADVLREGARTARVRLAERLALFVGPGEMYEALARAIREEAVLGPREGEFVGVLFDPEDPGRRERLRQAAEQAGTRLALGPAVPLAQARRSLARARALLELMAGGLVGPDALMSAEDHELALLLAAEPRLAGEFARRRLAPLDAVGGAATRANLALTLRAWLRAPGQRKAIAEQLDVHPQTVRYRMARLRELFGAQLDDPDGRFELELALRVEPFAETLVRAEGSRPVPSTP